MPMLNFDPVASKAIQYHIMCVVRSKVCSNNRLVEISTLAIELQLRYEEKCANFAKLVRA